MRWIVEVAPIGSKESQSYCVEADSWQKALQSARKLRDDNTPMSGFSIELLADGCKAVDPTTRLRYDVKRTADDAELTPGGEAPPSSSRKSKPPRKRTSTPSPAPVEAKAVQAPAPVAAPAPAPVAAATPAKPPVPTSGSMKAVAAAPGPVKAVPTLPVLIRREQDPTAETPLTYREYAFGLPQGSNEERAEQVLKEQLVRIQAEIARAPAGKLVNLAAFDVVFEGRPKVLPIATLTWKDWRADTTVAFPRRDRTNPPVSGPRAAQPAPAPAPAPQPAPAPVAAVVPIAPAPVVVQPVAPPAPQPAPVAAAPVVAPAVVAAPPPAPAPVAAPVPVAPAAKPASVPRTPAAAAQKGRVAGEELIAVLFEAMHDLHFLKDAIEAGDFCLTLASEKLPARASFIHLYDINHREFVLVCARAANADAMLLGRQPESEQVLAAAMRKRRGVLFAPGDPVLGQSAIFLVAGGAKSAIVAPVMQAGRFLGAITLLDPLDGVPFTELDANAMSYMAEQYAEFVGARGVVVDPERVKPAPVAEASR